MTTYISLCRASTCQIIEHNVSPVRMEPGLVLTLQNVFNVRMALSPPVTNQNVRSVER